MDCCDQKRRVIQGVLVLAALLTMSMVARARQGSIGPPVRVGPSEPLHRTLPVPP
jgi:hypothetical protein